MNSKQHSSSNPEPRQPVESLLRTPEPLPRQSKCSDAARLVFSLLSGAFLLVVLGLAGYGAYRLFVPEMMEVPVSLSVAQQSDCSETETSSSDDVPLPPTQQKPVVIGPELDLVVQERSDESEVSLAPTVGSEPLTAAEIVQNVLPSVVGINTYEKNGSKMTSSGSGFVLSEDGYIVTCAHLVENVNEVMVVLSNGKQKSATLVGLDDQTDLAVLKIEAKSLIPVTFCDSAQLTPGETVVALGNPGGANFTGTVTQGILNAPGRTVKVTPTSYNTMDALQVSAVIDPGNMGGPLCDEYGKVIGLCTDQMQSEEYAGSYFAIPTSVLVPVVADLVQYGRVTGRVWLGIGAVVITDALSKLNNLPVGIMVTTIYEGSNLYDAGLRVNDIIMTIDGKSMTSLDILRDFLASHAPGDLVTLTVYRRGEESELSSDASSDSSSESGESALENDHMLQIYLYLMEDTGSLVGTIVPATMD